MTLDCENFDSCIASLATILKLPTKVLSETLCGLDLEECYKSGGIMEAPDHYLFQLFIDQYRVSPQFDSSYWFHSSRVRIGTDFKEGILPLKQVILELLAFVDHLASTVKPDKTSQQVRLIDSRSSSQHFYTKTKDKLHWGPYAYLVRQSAIQPCSMSYNYL